MPLAGEPGHTAKPSL